MSDNRIVLMPCCDRHLAFEVAVGMNGLVWILSRSAEECVIIRNAILNSLDLDTFHTEAMVDILMEKMKARKVM